jgi:hypothetical protein
MNKATLFPPYLTVRHPLTSTLAAPCALVILALVDAMTMKTVSQLAHRARQSSSPVAQEQEDTGSGLTESALTSALNSMFLPVLNSICAPTKTPTR